MIRSGDVVWCDGCGVEIVWPPLVIDARPYCCRSCAEGYECQCAVRQTFDDGRRTPANAAAGTSEVAEVFSAHSHR